LRVPRRFLSRAAFLGAAATVLVGLIAPAAHAQIRLTGVLQFGADQNGAFNSGFYNTNRPDGSFDLAVIAGAPDMGGASGSGDNARNGTFLNDLTNARVNVSLNAPGDYTFTILGGTGYRGGLNGLNLFFNDNDANPGISVFAEQQTSLASTPAFSVNSNADSRNLPVDTIVPAAGTATFASSGLQAQLIGFSFGSSSLYSPEVDRIGNIVVCRVVEGSTNGDVKGRSSASSSTSRMSRKTRSHSRLGRHLQLN